MGKGEFSCSALSESVSQVAKSKLETCLTADCEVAPANRHWLVRVLARWKEAGPLSFLRPPFKHFRDLFCKRNGPPRITSLPFGNETEAIRRMSPIEQLRLVERYLTPFRGPVEPISSQVDEQSAPEL
jgi:hypothetical protein